MEASILARLDFVKSHGFSTKQSGGEHVQGGWLDKVKGDEFIIESVRPSYAYVWGDGLHKTSGSIDNPDNFENHMNASQDFGEGKKLEPASLAELQARFRARLMTGDKLQPYRAFMKASSFAEVLPGSS